MKTPVDHHALAVTLLAAERDAHDVGWDQPDMLFAVHGPWWCPRLEYILQGGGPAGELLHELLEIRLQARAVILGLVFVAAVDQAPNLDEQLLLGLPERIGGLEDPAMMVQCLVAAWGAAGGPGSLDSPKRGPAVVAVMRDGYTVAAVRNDDDRVHLVERIPQMVGDHEEMTGLAMRLMGDGPSESGLDRVAAS